MAPQPKPTANPEIKYTKLFINNEWVDSVSGKKFTTINPANEKVIAEVSEAEKADVDKAVKVARAAFERGSVWRNLDASARGRLIYNLAQLIEDHVNEIASLESLDNGKPFNNSYYQTLESTNVLRYFAGCADKIHGLTIPSDGKEFALTRKEPVGVVGAIIPWNYPIILLSFKLGMALAAGCTVVVKPAEQTPLTALYVASLVKEAGFPPGVVNVLPGYGPSTGAAISSHPDIDKVSFTGSSVVGKAILEASAKSNLKKVSLELGGKSPLVVFNDANLELALKYASDALFVNAGQTCIAPTRVFVQSGVYDKFTKRFVEIASKVKVGDAFEPGVFQGPQIDTKGFNKVLSLIETGKKEGAKCEIGGKRRGNVGYFVEPTVFTNVSDDMTIAKEEIFGPVQSIFKFETLDEVIKRANNTPYGLSAGVFTENLNTALEFSKAVQAGTVWVNQWGAVHPQTPFGGYKTSGLGREMGIGSLDEYLETKTINISLPSNH
ncbi:retinal dehydrogenase 1 isoform X1 [Nasonia vitripennis]|uniref:Aldehyde dehydrogenase domain-containing protein n=1 Tax=Nasonia vitripennis TaxID=7425 RepID=A0A7M7QAD0_NASVI|nr:retinal dehydrogenase 1 isoform X1 [Nasonia vitripennis]XP_031784506.1 retinal dehydrogenase 1 isoform X1 [Nasonia vitripennis]